VKKTTGGGGSPGKGRHLDRDDFWKDRGSQKAILKATKTNQGENAERKKKMEGAKQQWKRFAGQNGDTNKRRKKEIKKNVSSQPEAIEKKMKIPWDPRRIKGQPLRIKLRGGKEVGKQKKKDTAGDGKKEHNRRFVVMQGVVTKKKQKSTLLLETQREGHEKGKKKGGTPGKQGNQGGGKQCATGRYLGWFKNCKRERNSMPAPEKTAHSTRKGR